jgi:hypothetical protein
MPRRRSTHPDGFIVPEEHIGSLTCSGFGPSSRFCVTTMASSDFCPITPWITPWRAMRILLVLLSMIRSYPAIATEYAWTFVSPVVRSGISHKADLIACETDLPG